MPNIDKTEPEDAVRQNWTKFGSILAICALLGLLLVFASRGNSANRSDQATLASRATLVAETLASMATSSAVVTAVPSTQTPTRTPSATPLPTATPTRTPRPVANLPPTRIRIPSIHADADVIEVDYEVQREEGNTVTVWKVADFAVGFHSGTAYPGHAGNTVLAGHNNIRGRVFRHLLDLQLGDDIYLYVGEQEFRYVVSQILLVKEKGMAEEIRRDNAQWIQPTADERLTLVSCWPFIQPDHRVFVIAFPPQD